MPSTNLRSGASDHNFSAAWHLYVAGAGLGQISETMNIPYSTLAAFANRHHWRKVRQDALDHASKALRENLAQRVAKHKNNHMHFVLDQLTHTQAHIEQMEIGDKKDEGQVPIGQKLAVLKQHDDLARRTLGLDEESNNNAVAQGFAFIIAQRQQQNMPSAMMSLPDDSEAKLGILRSLNAHPDEVQEGNFTPIQPTPERTGPEDCQHVRKTTRTNSSDDTYENCPDCGQQRKMNNGGDQQWYMPTEFKPLPKSISFSAPKPLVNESPDEPTDSNRPQE